MPSELTRAAIRDPGLVAGAIATDVWRREGPAVVAACDAWMQLELAIAAARRYVQQAEASAGSDALLRRERERLEEVRVFMAALQRGPAQAALVVRAASPSCTPPSVSTPRSSPGPPQPPFATTVDVVGEHLTAFERAGATEILICRRGQCEREHPLAAGGRLVLG